MSMYVYVLTRPDRGLNPLTFTLIALTCTAIGLNPLPYIQCACSDMSRLNRTPTTFHTQCACSDMSRRKRTPTTFHTQCACSDMSRQRRKPTTFNWMCVLWHVPTEA